jgi:MFS family permease
LHRDRLGVAGYRHGIARSVQGQDIVAAVERDSIAVAGGAERVTGAINYLDRQTLAIGNPEIRAELGLSVEQVGYLLAAFSLSYAFAQLPTGGLVDKIGPRKLLGIGLTIWSVAQGFAGFVSGYTQFFYARIILGIGEAPQFPTGARVVSNWFNVRDRGLPTGIFNSASTLGPAIAPLLLTWLMLTWGWRAMFIAMGVLGVVAAIIWYAAYRDPGETDITTADHAAIREGEPSNLTGIIVQRTGSFIPALILGAGIAATSALIYTFAVKRPISGADLDAITG